MLIFPIAITQVNWVAFTQATEKYVGHSPTRALDNEKLPVGTHESFLSALGSFKNINNNPREIKNFSLNHVNITLLLIIDERLYFEFIEESYEEILFIRSDNFESKNEVAIIATGTLKAWKNFCLNQNKYVTELQYHIYTLLIKIGYNIFSDYKIVETLNGSKEIVRRH